MPFSTFGKIPEDRGAGKALGVGFSADARTEIWRVGHRETSISCSQETGFPVASDGFDFRGPHPERWSYFVGQVSGKVKLQFVG
jgi:hypothetical protein